MTRILVGFVVCFSVLCACGGPLKTVPPPPPNGTLSLTLRVTPPPLSGSLSILSFRATIIGISLGSSVNVDLVPGAGGSYVVEFTRLQSDSALLSTAVSIPAGTYDSIAVTFSDIQLTYCTQPYCSSGSSSTLVQVTGSPGTATATSSVFPLTVAAGEKLGLALDLNIPNAITEQGQTISAVNLAAANVLAATILQSPSNTTDLSSGQLAHIDDLYGIVSNVSPSSQSLTLETAYRGTVTLTANSSTTYDPSCSAQSFSCVTSGALAAADAILNDDGTLTVRNYSPVPFTAASKDTIEGLVYTTPNAANQVFDIVVTDASFAQSNSLLRGAIQPGDLVIVGVVTPQPFFIVSEGLLVPANLFVNSTGVGVIHAGQTVALSVSGFVPTNGSSAFNSATANGIALRFTRLTGTVASVATSQFGMTSLPAFLGLTANPFVGITNTGPGTTTDFDGTSRFTEAVGDNVSISALYFGSSTSPAFSAATIRKQ